MSDSYIEWQRVTANGITSDNEFQRLIQWVTKSDNDWQQMTAIDKEWNKEWDRIRASKKGGFGFQNEAKGQFDSWRFLSFLIYKS